MKRHIIQWLGSLCCSRLSWIKALHGLRDAVIGVEEDGTNAEKWILLDPAAEPSRTLESLQHLIAPLPPFAKQRSRKRGGEPSGWAPHNRCPRELPAYAGPVFTAPSDAASAYNSSRKKCHSTGTKKYLMPVCYFHFEVASSSVLICKDKKLSAYMNRWMSLCLILVLEYSASTAGTFNQ